MGKFFILDEVYFSKSPNVMKMEECFRKLTEVQKKNPKMNLNDAKEVEVLRKLIQDTFNFEYVYFNIDGNAASMNACTLPYMWNKNHEENLKSCEIEKSKYGMRYKNSKGKQILVCHSERSEESLI